MLPVEEYLRTSYEPEMEYVAGELVDRHVGEYFHSLTQAWIASLFGNRECKRRFVTFLAVRVQVDNECYRVPDICIKALPHQITPILSQPDLVVEVLSPEEEAGDMLAKIADYCAVGIKHIWLIDPYKRKVIEVGGAAVRVSLNLVLSTPLVGEVDFAALFDALNRQAPL